MTNSPQRRHQTKLQVPNEARSLSSKESGADPRPTRVCRKPEHDEAGVPTEAKLEDLTLDSRSTVR